MKLKEVAERNGRSVRIACVMVVWAVFGMSLTGVCAAAKPVKRIAFVHDGPTMTTKELIPVFRQELSQLLSGEFTVQFPADLTRHADFTPAGVQRLLKQMLTRSDIDLLIALGPVTSREACLLKSRPIPIIAAIVLDHVRQKIPFRNGTSGVHNLSYIEMPDTFREDLSTFHELRSFNNLVVLGGRSLFAAIPDRGFRGRFSVDFLEADIQLVEAGRDAAQTIRSMPESADAVYLLPISEFSLAEHRELLNSLALKRLPVFALLGHQLVREGALAGLNKADWPNRLARRAALNARRIFSGQEAGPLPGGISRQAELMINMRTARLSGIYPSYRVLSDAVVINEEPEEGVRELDLLGVMDEAVLVNLDLIASGRNISARQEDVRRARARLWPQLSARASETMIDRDRGRSPSAPAEYTLTGSLSMTQVLWSDSVWSNLTVEKLGQLKRTMEWEQSRLDVALGAATAYLNVMLAKAQQEIQVVNLRLSRSNLTQAKIRKDLGAGSAAEVYRLESKIAQERADLLAAEAQRRVAEIELNRLLAYPLEQPVVLADVTLGQQVSTLLNPQVLAHADNARQLEYMKQFLVSKGLFASPELMQIDADIRAEKRRRKAARRSFYSPELSVSGDLSHVMDESGAGDQNSTANDMDDTNWNLSLNVSIPLSEGGARLADLAKSNETLNALGIQRRATLQRIEQRIRSAVHQAAATYPAIDLLKDAARSSRKNFDLVADAYGRGTVSLIDLLDAQTSFLQAEQRAVSAGYEFLLDLMELERSLGRFTFFTSEKERSEWVSEILNYLEKAEEK